MHSDGWNHVDNETKCPWEFSFIDLLIYWPIEYSNGIDRIIA